MNMILRIQYTNKIEDYDLSVLGRKITVGPFQASPVNGWHYRCGNAQGSLQVGNVILIDKNQGIAALVLEKVQGRAAYLDWADGITIGRKSDNLIVLKDNLVSSHHCRIIGRSGKWYVEDLNSTNGTFLNDKRVRTAVLNPGDVLKLGRYRLKAGKQLCLENMDGGITLNLPEAQRAPEDIFGVKSYPWFSPAPRIIIPQEPLSITIESAPAIGDKPTMGSGGLAVNPTMMAVSLGMQALRYGLSRKKYSKQEQQRAEIYANYLADIEDRLQSHAKQQLEEAQRYYPRLDECLSLVNGPHPSLWERHSGDIDFLALRLGTGTEPARATITIPPKRLQLQEDELDSVPEQLAQKYSHVENMPIYTNLLQDGNCALLGNRELTVSMAKRMAAQLASLHGYDEVKLIVLYREEEKAHWEWMRWLPHCLSGDRCQRYMICGSDGVKGLEPLERLAKQRMDAHNQWVYGQGAGNLPHLVFLVAAPELLNNSPIGAALMRNQPELGISGIFLGERMTDFPHSVRNVVELQGSPKKYTIRLRTDDLTRTVDQDPGDISPEAYDRFARAMAPIRLQNAGQSQTGFPSSLTLFDGLGIRSLETLDLGDYWNANRPESSLEVPIGVKANGERFFFNIHQKGHGPHGLVAGGTGSGKSQMAHTWIASMALQFSPEEVNFVLVDFKGDSLLQPLKELPHLAGSISNLDKNVARSFLAMESELERRQRVLSQYQCNDIIAYIKKRRKDPQMPAMPYLILVVDEFAEFKTQFPDFSRALDHLYRGGRSLGLFVLLMTQSPTGIITDQMQANVAFRWCLFVNNESDSREVLGNTDAYRIRNPGRAYIKSGDTYELIQSYFAGADYQQDPKQADNGGRVYTVDRMGRRKAFVCAKKETFGSGKTQLTALVEHIRDYAKSHRIPKAQRLWQEELPEQLDLFGIREQGPCWTPDTHWNETLREEHGPVAVLGMVDDPGRQMQYPMIHDFWEDGHLAVYGMPSAGKTTFLQTLQVSLCSRYNPEQVQFYTLDIGGHALRALEILPHVGAAAGADEPENVEKIMKLLLQELAQRKKLFRREGAGSPGAYADAVGTPMSTIIILADNLNLARHAMPSLSGFMNDILKLAREGAAYGIYLACSFSGTSEVNYSLLQSIKSICALQLADKADYGPVVGRPGNVLPDGTQGRGLVKVMPAPLLFQTAVAYGDLSDSKRTQMIRSIARQMDDAWNGERPKGIVSVAEEIPFGSLEGKPFILGADMESGESVSVTLDAVSLLLSDGANMKEDMLRSLLRQAVALQESQVVLYTCEPAKYENLMDGHTMHTSPQALDQAVEPLAVELRKRQKQLRENPEAQFAPLVIILDGLYDCISRCHSDTVARLEVFIRLGKQLGVFVAALDNAQLMGKCRFQGDILTETMRQGPALLAGGALAVHQVVDSYGIQAQYPQAMDEQTAILTRPDGKAVQLRRMSG